MATHSLNQHSAQASPEWMHMRCAVLFKSNQPAEASAQTVEWIRSGDSLPYSAASDAIALLCQHQAYQSALTAVNVLSERLAAGFDGADHVATQGSEISLQYSELQEVRQTPLATCVSIPPPNETHVESRLRISIDPSHIVSRASRPGFARRVSHCPCLPAWTRAAQAPPAHREHSRRGGGGRAP